jgi:CheY-like chemotaxis protein
MQERMRLIDGQLSIESKPHHGTTVRASVELTAEKVHADETVSNQRASRPIAGCVKVLIVEDYEPFRRFVCAALQRRGDDFDLTEASDGLEAVRKAEELQPDLILLDIDYRTDGLKQPSAPWLLRQFLFVSQESSSEVIHEAFRLGGEGYVHKSHAHADLLAADAVLRASDSLVVTFTLVTI